MPTLATGIYRTSRFCSRFLFRPSPAFRPPLGKPKTQTRSRLTGSGFTLIEVLVVSLIIAIIAGTVFLSFDLTERAQVRDKAARLQHVLRNLGSEAVLTGRICGVRWEGTALKAECRNSYGEVESMDGVLGRFAWGNKMNLAMYGEDGDKLHPKDKDDEEYEDEDEAPNKFYDIQMWSTGLWEPAGSIVFKSASNKIAYLLVSWTASGRLSVMPVEDQLDYIEDYDPWDNQ